MPDDVVLVRDAVAAEHVPAVPRDVERLAAVVALQHRDHLRRVRALVLEPPELQARLQAQRDLGQRVGHLLLYELKRQIYFLTNNKRAMAM